MRTPTPAQLLEVWERGSDQSAAVRARLLFGASCDDLDGAAQAALPLGQRDARLLELRARLFGPEVTGTATCPRCVTAVEATFRCSDLQARAGTDAAGAGERTLWTKGARVRYRLPAGADLEALAAHADVAAAREDLLARCVLDAEWDGTPCAPRELPPPVVDALAQAMAEADPQADLRLAFACPECGHAWELTFDIASFLWQELDAWAQRLLRDIDALARAYHWREADILALSPRRRQAYLELCAS
ncbi:MAG TPA: hypothetical protein VF216_08795 [Mizugakiibacter sp.]